MEKILKIEETSKIAKEIIKKITKNIKKEATVLAFYGDLGVGKTTITKELAKQMGIVTNVVSPTFVIMKIYKTKNKIFENLIHIDAYRLKNSDELKKLGFEEIVKNQKNLIIIEWPEIVESILPKQTHKIFLTHKDETTRNIKL